MVAVREKPRQVDNLSATADEEYMSGSLAVRVMTSGTHCFLIERNEKSHFRSLGSIPS